MITLYVIGVLVLFSTLLIGQEIPPNYKKFRQWKVIHKNSSGSTFWRIGTNPQVPGLAA